MSEFDPEAFDPLPPEASSFVERYIEEEHGYLSWLGTNVETVERGRVVLSVPFNQKLTNADGATIHGGVAATLVDTAGGVAQRTTFSDPLSGDVATVNLNVNYLRPANGDLRAEAEVVRAGGSIGVSDMRVTTGGEGGGTGGDGITDGGGDGGVDGGGDGGGGGDGENGRSEVVVGQGSFRLFRE